MRSEKLIKFTFYLIILPVTLFIFSDLHPQYANAEDPNFPEWKLQVDIPGMAKFDKPLACETVTYGDGRTATVYCINWLATYMAGVYRYSIGILGILAAMAVMIGGIRWLVAGGDAGGIKEAKSWIASGITGMTIGLCIYVILNVINPELLNLKPIKVAGILKEPINLILSNPYNSIANRYTKCEVAYLSCSAVGKSDAPQNNCPDWNNIPAAGVDVAQKVCCCEILPVPGCGWTASPCNDQQRTGSEQECGTKTDPGKTNCCCAKGGNSECEVQEAGLCDWRNFQSAFGNEVLAKQASQICSAESGGRCVTRSEDTYVSGPMQIHLPVHNIGGFDCKNSFRFTGRTKQYTNADGSVITIKIYEKVPNSDADKCIEASCNPQIFATFSKTLYDSRIRSGRPGWEDWCAWKTGKCKGKF